MSKQIVNIGTAANSRNGDSLRAAFQKVNANFTELYTALGISEDAILNLGAFEFTDSIMSTTDSTPITIDQSVTITSDLTVGGDILPSENLTSTLGSPTKQFHSIYVGTGSVYLGDAKLSLESGKLTSSVGFNLTGSVGEVSGAIEWDNVLNKPTFSSVATSGSYDDLSDKPTIPSIAGLATETYVDDAIAAIPETDLTGLATETYVDDAIAAIPAVDLSGLATETYVDDAIAAIPAVDLSGYVTQADLAAGSITVDVNNTGDLKGSVFADDSTLLVDAVNGVITGNVTGNLVGDNISIGRVDAGEVDIYGDVEFNNGTTSFQSGNSVSFNGPVDFTNATVTGLSSGFDQTLNTTDSVRFSQVYADSFFPGSDTNVMINAPFLGGSDAGRLQITAARYPSSEGEALPESTSTTFVGASNLYGNLIYVEAGWRAYCDTQGLAAEVISVSTDEQAGKTTIELNIEEGAFSTGDLVTFINYGYDGAWINGAESFIFDADGKITLANDGVSIGTSGMSGRTNFDITVPNLTEGSVTFSFTAEGGPGELVFPDGTRQSTAFLGGSPTELNDEENGNKLIINSNGDVIFTDSDGTLETPSGGGVDRGIFWDFGVTAGGTDSYIRQTDGGLWIHPYTTEPENPFSDSGLNILVGDPEAETPAVWRFEATGGVRFPDDTVQTTAYPGQQLEIDGGDAFTIHSIADLEIDGGGA